MANQKSNTGTSFTAAMKKQVTILNKELMQASSEMIDATTTTISKWQDLSEKMMNTGVKLFGAQQDIVLNGLEAIKGQYLAGSKRFNKLVGNSMAKSATKVAATATETASKTKKVITSKIKEAQNA
jgi:hypothetical protein